jgi:hypothetical protein
MKIRPATIASSGARKATSDSGVAATQPEPDSSALTLTRPDTVRHEPPAAKEPGAA